MENQSLSSSSFSFPHDLNSVVVDVEEEAMNNLEQKSPDHEIVYERTISERPSSRLDVVGMERDNNIDFSKRGWFPSPYAQANSSLLFGGSAQDFLSNDNHLGLMGVYQSLDVGVTRGVMDMNMAPYTSFIDNSGYSSPLRYGEGVSSRNAYPFFNEGVMFASNNYRSNDDICLDLTLGPSKPCNNYGSNEIIPNDICLDLTLGPAKTTGSSEPSNNYEIPNDICLDLTLGPSKTTGGGSEPSNNYEIPNDDICLDLTLGPSKSTEVTRGAKNLNNLVRTRTTSLCSDMFSLQENGSCPSDPKGKKKVMVSPE